MATAKTNTEPKAVETDAYWREKVTINLFKDNGKYKDDVTVIENGKAYRIQRGVDVQVPRSVSQILKESNDQKMATSEMIDMYEREYEEHVKNNVL